MNQWWQTDFDPMQVLIEHGHQIQQLNRNIIEVARAHNQSEESMLEIVQQHNQLIEQIKVLKSEIERLKRSQNS